MIMYKFTGKHRNVTKNIVGLKNLSMKKKF